MKLFGVYLGEGSDGGTEACRVRNDIGGGIVASADPTDVENYRVELIEALID